MKANLLMPIILQLLGVIVVIAEFVLPSGGLLTIAAIGLFAYSLYVAFTDISTAAGFIFVAIDIVLIPVLIISGLKLLAKSPVTLKKTLSQKDGVESQSSGLKDYLNSEGIAASDLRPAGMAVINNKRVDVVTRGEYIEKDTAVKVVEVSGNQLIVEIIDDIS